MRRAWVGLGALALVTGTALAAPGTRILPAVPVPTAGVASASYACQSAVRPGSARIGQPVLYRGRVVVRPATELRWQLPVGGDAFEWGVPQIRRIPGYSGALHQGLNADTMQIELTLQAFTPGMLSVPGLGFEVRERTAPPWTGRLPVVRLAIVPVVSPDDTSATLRPLRGPFGAPWWERVPWSIVAPAALALAIAGFLVRRLGRRRAPEAGQAPVRTAKDPATVALDALAALRGLRLPDQGRFAAHALELTRILRRFLEATQGAPRPGDSTPELVVRLETTRLAPAERERVAGLLAAWDRVKFARAASTPVEARWAEDAVEGLARRHLRRAGQGAA